MSRRVLPLIPAGLSVVQVLPAADCMTILTIPTAISAACPTCGQPSRRVHSHYTRALSDLPWQGRPVIIRIRARRFRCASPACPRQIFAERLPEVTRPWAHRSARLASIQRHIGLAVGGEPGSRLAARLAMPVSGDTLLRMIRAVTPQARAAPRVIGIDEWAWRRGLTYGTILCDLERGGVIDVLPDRSAATLSAWLKQHPSVAIIARDRASVFAEGIRQGAPAALQVADRWHLLRNLGDALRTAVDRHRTAIIAAARAVAPADPPEPRDTRPAGRKLEALRQERRDRRRERYITIRRLRDEGVPPRLIAPVVGMSQRAVERWLAAGGEPEHRRPPVTTLIDPFRRYLERRWQEGCHNTTALWREITAQGFTGSVNTVARWAAPYRDSRLPSPAAVAGQVAAAWRPPSRRRCTWLLSMEPDQLEATERAFIDHLIAAAPALGTAASLTRRLAAMIRGGDDADLDAWLAAAQNSELASFAQGLNRDITAIRAAITEPWSTSPVEGQINRLKMIKRQMYGRASYDLLRQRLLVAA